MIGRGDTRPSRHLDITSEVISTNEKQEEWKPTLVEVSWSEINLPLNVANAVISSKLFPKSRTSKRDYETLISVTGLDVDARGRLWVLDAPDGYDRWPRIIIYDLKRNDRLEVQNVTVTWLGKKLGSSVGLFSDLKDGLHYFMTSERASVRWNTKLPLNAQSHSVLVQNDDVPCITDYIMDARRNIWGLVNLKCPGATKENTLGNSTLKSRTIKIQKYYFAMQ
ncbi:hypothetical protein G5I_09347 [Acromyrmex echinatior]|uniref:Bee-milk protein n=1 Tax=Acromyrmex echinatior TaxID=103372 RepID=F4WTZ4_ACREC|nr:hypothetical protein G5I_09347 [Acromyrmex echinatior]